ncbi:hypothetical protein MTBUT4_20018 [Magnetospirillum sp. UT-4]|nr:hypothetical protein MTBUT4_20018 [Magnetospirillum sp. UT-4]
MYAIEIFSNVIRWIDKNEVNGSGFYSSQSRESVIVDYAMMFCLKFRGHLNL